MNEASQSSVATKQAKNQIIEADQKYQEFGMLINTFKDRIYFPLYSEALQNVSFPIIITAFSYLYQMLQHIGIALFLSSSRFYKKLPIELQIFNYITEWGISRRDSLNSSLTAIILVILIGYFIIFLTLLIFFHYQLRMYFHLSFIKSF